MRVLLVELKVICRFVVDGWNVAQQENCCYDHL
jgi:hypothetical protein